ncbi:MAG: Rpn family recombination-promoting nuclease/putative transposase [Lachnospiraceae bacterium]|nr:Rpn family recombination-promoting nuclease/putative transposase [Lachnospiraceae bacterium]
MSKNSFISEVNSENASYLNASGPVLYPLTNDYLFRAVLQKNNFVLKGLICSLLHLSSEEVQSVTISNPIKLGKSIKKKDFFLDISVLLNNATQLNLEMQVINYGNWPERSLSYLCRTFDSLNSGENYQDIKPVIHIGFLDFTLFPEFPEFYAKYQLLNVKNHLVYSDKFTLSVIDLTQIKLATAEDKAGQLDYWASLFKANTWEEIKMIAKNNSYFSEAAETMYHLSADEEIRLQCQARADFERLERSNNARYAAADAENKALKEENAMLKADYAALKSENKSLMQEHVTLKDKYNSLAEKYASMQEEFAGRLAALEAKTNQ